MQRHENGRNTREIREKSRFQGVNWKSNFLIKFSPQFFIQNVVAGDVADPVMVCTHSHGSKPSPRMDHLPSTGVSRGFGMEDQLVHSKEDVLSIGHLAHRKWSKMAAFEI